MCIAALFDCLSTVFNFIPPAYVFFGILVDIITWLLENLQWEGSWWPKASWQACKDLFAPPPPIRIMPAWGYVV